MTPREQFLADCAEVWDRSDDQAVFAFGAPGQQVALFAGPMTVHQRGPWLCFHADHADAASLSRLVDALSTPQESLQ